MRIGIIYLVAMLRGLAEVIHTKVSSMLLVLDHVTQGPLLEHGYSRSSRTERRGGRET